MYCLSRAVGRISCLSRPSNRAFQFDPPTLGLPLSQWYGYTQIREVFENVSSSSKVLSSAVRSPCKELSWVALGACGWLLPFHFGVLSILEESGHVGKNTGIIGASGGAIAAATYKGGVPPVEAVELVKKLGNQVRKTGLWGKLEHNLISVLEEFLPADAHIRSEGRLALAATRLWPYPRIKPVLLKDFTSKRNLIDAVNASSYIPFYSSVYPTMKFRGKMYVDGGLVNIIPSIPGALKICTFPKEIVPFSRCPEYHIGPDMQLAHVEIDHKDLSTWTLTPPPSEKMDYLFELGANAARIWLQENHSLQSFSKDAERIETIGTIDDALESTFEPSHLQIHTGALMGKKLHAHLSVMTDRRRRTRHQV